MAADHREGLFDALSRFPTIRDRVQYRQKVEQAPVTRNRTLSGYRCTRPGTGLWSSSQRGSLLSPGEKINSSGVGTTDLRSG